MKTGKVMVRLGAALFSLVLLMHAGACVCAPVPPRLGVPMTLVQDAAASEALCLDGSLPAYHIHKGTGAGADNWLLQFEGGAWCNDLRSCKERAKTRRGSTTLMNKLAPFSGILSNNPSLNPDFHDWTRVKLRYCDGASFTGDAVHKEGDSVLYFRGSRIWEAIIRDLIPKGLGQAKKALLSGCSAGGLSAFLHCDNFTKHLPPTAEVKCLSDAGFFLDAKDISNRFHMRSLFMEMITLQGVDKAMDKSCTDPPNNATQCFFPQYLLKNVQTPLFILNSAYDVFQFSHILAPPSADRPGRWQRCRSDPAACSPEQINILQGFRDEMLAALKPHEASKGGGMFINSCFAHCQSESQDTWLAADSPKVNNKGISEAVGDWYFNRKPTKEIDCPYPCDKTCHNLIPEPKDPADPSETNSQI